MLSSPISKSNHMHSHSQGVPIAWQEQLAYSQSTKLMLLFLKHEKKKAIHKNKPLNHGPWSEKE